GLIAYTPAWANGGASKFHPPSADDDYARFAGRLARHFSAGRVLAWEIWNEPNLGQFWSPRADAAAYAALLGKAYSAIRTADPNAIVVSGGLAQPYPSARDTDALEFVRVICAASARERCFDAIGNHPYDSPRLPSERAAHNWQKMVGTAPANLRGMLAGHGRPETPVWITEYGAPTLGADSYGTVVSEDRQARMLEEAFRLVSGYPWSGPLFWYNFKDFCPPDPAQSPECFFGLLRHDGTYKPAALKYAAFAREEVSR
ncbi:MAG: beta-xylosidase, partial [Comamonadaceae bacterium]